MNPEPHLLQENVQVHRGAPEVPVLILCEHADKLLPPDLDLGVSPPLLDTHWGWDRWAWDTLQAAALPLGASLLGSRVTRLAVDVNRPPKSPTLIRTEAEGQSIPGNLGLTPAQVEARIQRFHMPYHAAADAELARLMQIHRQGLVLFSLHSFTGEYGEQDRAFEAGVLFDGHEELVERVATSLRGGGLSVRLNEPYSGYNEEIYSVARHGRKYGLPYFELELNQHYLEDAGRRAEVAEIVGELIQELVSRL